jgi:hypothetical protein
VAVEKSEDLFYVYEGAKTRRRGRTGRVSTKIGSLTRVYLRRRAVVE